MSFDGFVTKILDALFEKKKNTDEEFCLFCRTASPQEIQNAISSGANINGRNEFGGTPLMCAAVSNENVESIKTLVKFGAALVDIDDSMKTVLHYAVINKNPEVVKYLLDAGLNLEVNETDINGNTPLTAAAQFYISPKVIEILAKAGANLNAQNDEGFSALGYAIMYYGHNNAHEMIPALIKAGADVNERNNPNKVTLFMMAVRKINNESIIEAFIRGGADLNLRDIYGHTALDHAIEGNNEAAIKVIQKFQAKPKITKPAPITVIKPKTPDIDLRKLFMDDMIDEAIKNGADPNQIHDGQPILSYFVLEHRSAPVISLLKAGAKPNLIYTDSKGRKRTPFSDSLHMARKYADIKELNAEGDACLEVVAACIVYGGSLKLIKEKCPDVLEAVCTANDKHSLSWDETVMLKLNEMINSGVLR